MAFHINDKKGGKPGSNNPKNLNAGGGSKFIAKPSKAVAATKKPIKTGGSRGS